ncbi:MAG TPA: porin family protein [Parafilimonas sp.]|nr:porin family protein [Parafilimonas sp.]
MKIIFCLLTSYILLNCSNAQSFGITAGPTFAFYDISVGNVSVTSDIKTGFSGGLVSHIPVSKYLSFRPELKYVQKGGTLKQDGYSDKMTLNYIELPVNFVFNTHSAKGMFFAGLGPSFNLGLSGKSKGDDGDYDVKFGGGEEDDFKPFEIGLNALIGYQFKGGLFFSANSNMGLNNVGNDFDYDSEYHNWYFGINIGFMFNSNPKPAAPAATN